MPGSGVAHLYSQNWEVDRGRRISEFDWGQAGLQSEFQGSQGYTEKHCLRKKKKSKQEIKQANKQTNSRQTTIYKLLFKIYIYIFNYIYIIYI